MGKLCPVCRIVLLDDAGKCPSCKQDYDASSLPPPDKYEIARCLNELRRIQATRVSGGGGGGLGTAFGWVLRLAAIGTVYCAYLQVGKPQIAGGIAVAALLLWWLGGKAIPQKSYSPVTDKLDKSLDLEIQAARLEEQHKLAAAK